jgi:hypothetical protein
LTVFIDVVSENSIWVVNCWYWYFWLLFRNLIKCIKRIIMVFFTITKLRWRLIIILLNLFIFLLILSYSQRSFHRRAIKKWSILGEHSLFHYWPRFSWLCISIVEKSFLMNNWFVFVFSFYRIIIISIFVNIFLIAL